MSGEWYSDANRATTVANAAAQACALAASAFAVLALIGWAGKNMALAQFVPGYLPMAPATALALLSLGAGMFVRARWPRWSLRCRLATAAAMLAMALSGLLLIGSVGGFNLTLERLLVHSTQTVEGVPMGYMSPVSAATLLPASLALLALSCPLATTRVRPSFAGALAAGVMAVGLVLLQGYAYGMPLLYGSSIIPVAMPTAIALVLVGTGLIASAGPGAWPLRTVIGTSVRARLSRVLLPTMLALTIAGHWLAIVLLGQGANPVLGVAIASLLTLGAVGGAIVLIARSIGGAIDRTEQELAHASRAKDEFLARLSHELRTPLTPVMLAVSQWQMCEDLAPALCQDLSMMRRNLELEARLLEDLLDVNRIMHGKLPLRREVVDLHQVIAHALSILRADIQAKQLEVLLRLDAGRSWIDADAARVEQVIWNILSNAAKFTSQAGAITITTANSPRAAGEPAEQILVQITDSGRGIDPDLLPRLFKPFEQGGHQTTSHYGGLGLGLTICKSVVELHGGSVTAHSDGANRGATIAVRFPIVATPASAAPVRPQQGPPPARAGIVSDRVNGHSHKVLLVEDHPDTAKLLARLIRSWGHTVCTAHTVADALKMADSKPFDLLVSDLGLPDGNGHDLMRQLSTGREGTGGRSFKAIAVSGFGMDEDQQRSLEAGFFMHLTKPVSPAELRSAISAAFSSN